MTFFKINMRIDRVKPINVYFGVVCQMLRFDKHNNIIVNLSQTELLRLKENIDIFIKDYNIKEKDGL